MLEKTIHNLNLKIIVDTREQQPLTFNEIEGVSTCVDTLGEGDYTLSGYDMPDDDDSIIIERKKDCQELITNLGMKWEAFECEMQRMSKYKHKFIIVCGHNNFDYLFSRGMTKLHPNFVYKRLAEIALNYGVNVFFANNRSEAENFIYRLFLNIARKHEYAA